MSEVRCASLRLPSFDPRSPLKGRSPLHPVVQNRNAAMKSDRDCEVRREIDFADTDDKCSDSTE